MTSKNQHCPFHERSESEIAKYWEEKDRDSYPFFICEEIGKSIHTRQQYYELCKAFNINESTVKHFENTWSWYTKSYKIASTEALRYWCHPKGNQQWIAINYKSIKAQMQTILKEDLPWLYTSNIERYFPLTK